MAAVVFLFVIAAAFLVMALAGPYRLYWRARPHAPRQPSDTALALGRVAAFGVAGVFVFGGCSVQEGVDKRAWSASEVREAAEHAAEFMAADTQIRGDATDGYASLIEARVIRAGEDQGPSYGIYVERAGEGHDYEISASGSGAPPSACTSRRRSRRRAESSSRERPAATATPFPSTR
ncbi:hypothetical protein ACIREO_29235 [Streptomyces sp. NPDC102441]|uniref:hypothetical protein n=1 Tax=Streptomyces sp. NPDC102441 TaxID=3366176 RepID=UPI00381E6680